MLVADRVGLDCSWCSSWFCGFECSFLLLNAVLPTKYRSGGLLAVQLAHQVRVVSSTCGRARRNATLDLLQIRGTEFNVKRTQGFVEAVAVTRADRRHDA